MEVTKKRIFRQISDGKNCICLYNKRSSIDNEISAKKIKRIRNKVRKDSSCNNRCDENVPLDKQKTRRVPAGRSKRMSEM